MSKGLSIVIGFWWVFLVGLGLRIVVDRRGGPWVSSGGDRWVLVGFRGWRSVRSCGFLTMEISWVSRFLDWCVVVVGYGWWVLAWIDMVVLAVGDGFASWVSWPLLLLSPVWFNLQETKISHYTLSLSLKASIAGA